MSDEVWVVGLDLYRIQCVWRHHAYVPRRFWLRSWQAEWEGCQRAVRAYTRAGLVRRLWRMGIIGSGETP